MKLIVNIQEQYTETEIIVNCNSMNESIEKFISTIKMFDMKLIGKKDGQQCFIDISNIIYIESTDKRTFLYTTKDVYESPLRLFELEEKLIERDFLRASKNCLFNINYIHSLKSDLEQRLILAMENDIKIIVSRQYSNIVKEKLEAINA